MGLRVEVKVRVKVTLAFILTQTLTLTFTLKSSPDFYRYAHAQFINVHGASVSNTSKRKLLGDFYRAVGQCVCTCVCVCVRPFEFACACVCE